MDPNPPYDGTQANSVNAVALPVFALLGILITYLPCRSFWSHRNVPAVSIVVVTNIYNISTVLNAIIWPSDDWSSWWPGYGLCDIEALLRYPITIALASSLCGLSKGLADCLDTDNARVHQTAATRKRKMIFDILFCWAIPVLQMAFHYVVQAGRYKIWPVFGCADVVDDSWPTIVLIMIWCPVFTLLNMYYAVLLLIRLRKHRRSISSALSTGGSGLAARKYLKLVIITFSLIAIYFPVQLIFFFQEIPRQLTPYSWSRVHDPATWNTIEYLHTDAAPTIQYRGWASVVNSFLLWAYFGFNDNAVDIYRSWMVKLGLARIWPSLKNSREERMAMRSSRRGSSITRFSLTSNLDLVGKVMKYFDGDLRRASSTTAVDVHSNGATSRKGSHGTLSRLTTDPDRLHRKTSSPDSAAAPSSSVSNYTTSTPTFHEPVYPADASQISESARAAPTRRNFFSAFRTHLNVPFPLFGHRSASSQVNAGTQTQMQDLESQHQAYPQRTTSITANSAIWSGLGPLTLPAHATHVTAVSMPINEEDEEIDVLADIDPLAPKMGTRAYREREKREMQRRKEEDRVREKEAKIIADNVRIETAMEILGWSGKGVEDGGEKEVVGVRVIKSFEISEEGHAHAGSS